MTDPSSAGQAPLTGIGAAAASFVEAARDPEWFAQLAADLDRPFEDLAAEALEERRLEQERR